MLGPSAKLHLLKVAYSHLLLLSYQLTSSLTIIGKIKWVKQHKQVNEARNEVLLMYTLWISTEHTKWLLWTYGLGDYGPLD
jgi:hypothetical protein